MVERENGRFVLEFFLLKRERERKRESFDFFTL